MSKETKTVRDHKPNVREAAPIQIVDRVDNTGAVSEETLYEQNASVTAIFWEWRHKVLTHFFGVTGALLAVTGWLYYASGDLIITRPIESAFLEPCRVIAASIAHTISHSVPALRLNGCLPQARPLTRQFSIPVKVEVGY